MLLQIPQLLDIDTLKHCREILANADWVDGRITAGTQSAAVKHNQQLPDTSPASREAQRLVLAALSDSGLFLSAALPNRVYPPGFNRYEVGMGFGSHVDNAIRTHVASNQHIRTDIAITLFLSEPDEYDGGELVIEDTFGTQSIKLAAGDAILYPASSLHRVEPITRGCRLASFFWVQSRVRMAEQRRILFEMDLVIVALRTAQSKTQGESAEAIKLTACYHNLLRMWASE
jgi:PKHD-type hydroxylase